MDIIDFRIKRDGADKAMQSKNGFVLEMDTSTSLEVPVITDDLGELYTQTLAVMATINKGQLKDNPNYGITPDWKVQMNNVAGLDDVYRTKMLTELSDLAMDFFINNEEILNYVSSEYSVIEVGGNE